MIWVGLVLGFVAGVGMGTTACWIILTRVFADFTDRTSSAQVSAIAHITEVASTVAEKVGGVIRETMRPYPVDLDVNFEQPPPAYEAALARDAAARGYQPMWNAETEDWELHTPDGWGDTTPGTIE